MSSRTRTTENFPVGSWLIAAELRPAVHAFYRFAREADDIADDPAREADAKAEMLNARDRALADGGGGPEAALALRVLLVERGLTLDHPRHLLQAFLADARGRPCRTWSDLIAYCRFSAAPVGRFLLDLHGEDRALWPASDALCNALQVINHLQDCGDDYRTLDRVYLPDAWMRGERATVDHLAMPQASEALRRVIDRALERTETLMMDARRLPGAMRHRRLASETAVIVSIADALVKRLRRDDPLATRVVLNKWQLAGASLRGLAGLWL